MDAAAPEQAQLNHADHANMRSPSPRKCTLWQQLLFEILLCRHKTENIRAVAD
jgi:hypothetical protein